MTVMSYLEGYELGFDVKDLPCEGCHYCLKAHRNWALFAEEVDNVVPFASKTMMAMKVKQSNPILVGA